MTTEAEVYIDRLDYLRNEVKKAIHGMSAEELSWAPLPADTNSPCVLATHIAGSESRSIHQVVGGIAVKGTRDAEFAARVSRASELEALLDRVAPTTRSVLQNLSSDDLSQTRVVRPGEAPVSLRYVILRTIAHMGEHLGHLNLTKQFYAAQRGQR